MRVPEEEQRTREAISEKMMVGEFPETMNSSDSGSTISSEWDLKKTLP